NCQGRSNDKSDEARSNSTYTDSSERYARNLRTEYEQYSTDHSITDVVKRNIYRRRYTYIEKVKYQTQRKPVKYRHFKVSEQRFPFAGFCSSERYDPV